MSTENDETILGGSEPAPGPAKKSGGNPSAGMSAVPAGQLETGARLGDYEIERLLGAGAMGEVYLARQVFLNQKCAVKVLPPDLSKSVDFEDRFASEGKALAMLDHQNIVRVLNAGMGAGRHFLTMEFVDGGSLEDSMEKSGGRLPPALVRKVLDEILSGLEYAHKKNIVHRDLKPANILLSGSGHYKISDFGLALVAGDEYMQSVVRQSIAASQLAGLSKVRPPRPGNDDATLVAGQAPRPSERLSAPLKAPSSDATIVSGDPDATILSGNADGTIVSPQPSSRSRAPQPSVGGDATISAGDGHPGASPIRGGDSTILESEVRRGARRSSRSSDAAAFVGTLDYMSPEVRSGQPADGRSDLFAVGVMAYQMLTGHKPLGLAKPPSKIVQGLSPEWDDWAAKCMDMDPKDRFQSAAEARAALPVEKSVSSPKTTLLISAAVLAIAAVACAAVYLPGLLRGERPANAAAAPVAAQGSPDARNADPVPSAPLQSATGPQTTSSAPASGPKSAPVSSAPVPPAAALPKPAAPTPLPVRTEPAPAASAPVVEPGSLVVRTEPSGALVQVEGMGSAEAPASFRNLQPRAYRVLVSKDGYETVSTSISISAGEKNELPLLRLARQTGTLSLSTSPRGAEWKFVATPTGQQPAVKSGTTPAMLEMLPTGDYVVEFHREGWPAQRRNIHVGPGQTVSADGRFEGGTVLVESNPTGADVLDTGGRKLGVTPLVLTDLPEGDYTYLLSLPASRSVRVSGRLEAGRTLRLSGAVPPRTPPETAQAAQTPAPAPSPVQPPQASRKPQSQPPAAQTPAAPKGVAETATVRLRKGLTRQQVSDGVGKALAADHWTIEESADGRIVAKHAVNRTWVGSVLKGGVTDAVFTITYTETEVVITDNTTDEDNKRVNSKLSQRLQNLIQRYLRK